MGKSSGMTSADEHMMQQNDSALVKIAQGQAANSNKLFGAAFPGFNAAEAFYGDLSTGDPGKIALATAPATQQINQATQGSIKNIMQNAPAGGEKNLAIENAFVNQGAQVGKTASDSYLNSFNALASLAGQGVGESTAAAGTGISGFNSANQGVANLANLQIQQKGAQLGAITSLASDAATVGAAFA